MKKTCVITAMILMALISTVSYGVTPAGPLSVSGNRIVDQNDAPVSFAGMSYFWSNDGWGGSKYYNADCLNWLVSDWNVTIVRAAMGVEDGGGYIGSPTNNKNRLKTIVDASIAAGIYVLIDWHSHHAEDYQTEAIAFFEEMATTYGGYDNVIYEIYNEPLSGVSWSGAIKPYAEAVIAAIRAIDPDNLIIVGSPEWSQRVDLPAADPITGYINIAYTIHFYPDMGHTQWLRDRGTAAINSGIALMATEWGPKGTVGAPETVAWMDWCELNYVSHTAWAVNDKDEPWSILDPWIGMETGGWDANDLTTRGQILKDICLNWDGTAPPPPQGVNIALNQPTARSSIENSSYESANAVDGSESTRWSSQFSDPQWIYVDLGAQKTVDSVRLNWEAAYATSYQIEVSDDASAWTNAYSTSSGDGGIDDIDLGGVAARYVRMYGTQRATSYGYSLWEFEVYGTPPVLLYQNYDYAGWSAGFGSGSYTMADIIAAGGVNDDASSVIISPDYTVTLFEDDNFSGSSLVLTADTPNLGSYGFNDMLSSMTIVKDTGTGIYQESGGVCTMEAENATVDQRSDNITWVSATAQTGYIGSGYMTPPDNTGSGVVWSTGCELAWDVNISTAGIYYMAVRRIALDNGDDSARVGVNGGERDDNTFNGVATSWQWSRGTDFDLGSLSAGTHTIQIRRREDGLCIDRVMIADDWSKLPADGSTEAGPAESPTDGDPPDTTPPAAPTGLAATAGDATVSLDWNDNTEPDLAGYDAHRSTNTGGPYNVIAFDLTSSDYIDNTALNGTTYYYVVTAVDTSLNESANSNEDSATPADTTAPTPNPATFATAPAADSSSAISMTATTGSDASGPVEYFFDETSGNPGGTDSGWQTSPSYTDSSLSPSTQYTYTVTMRDSVTPTPNMGTPSAPANATTQAAPDTDPPTPNPATFAVPPTADSSSAISMTATTGSDASGPVEYFFDETSGNPGGTDSGWQTSESYTDSGLNASTQYTYTVQMRDSAPTPNVGTASSPANATTDSPSDVDDTANADLIVAGTVSGSYTDTQASDDGYESITERESGGNPNNRYSYLEHKWTVNVTGGQSVTFYVEAYQSASSDGDNFVFAYSTNDSSYTNMVTVTKTADDDAYQSYLLPASLSGTVYIRVVDTDQTQGNKTLDTISIDHMFIRSAAPGPPDTDPPTPDPATFAVPPAADSDTAISMTATTGSDASGPVQYYFDETSGNPGGTDSGWQTSPSYTDSGLTASTQYTYTVQMRDSAPTPNVGTASAPANATTDAGCTATDMHIEAVACGEVSCGGPNKNGQATVTIYDDCGNPLANALVDGTFTGDFSETIYDIATDANGQAVLTTSGCIKKPAFTFTVIDVTHGTLPYDSNDDLTTGCSG